MAAPGIDVTVVAANTVVLSTGSSFHTQETRVVPHGSPNGNRELFAVASANLYYYRWSDEGITWIRGHHAADSPVARALLVAHALRTS